MEHGKYEILIVEDNLTDAELMVRSLKKNYSANNMIILEDGEQALDFIFCRDQYANRNASSWPIVIFLDLKLPKVNGLEVLKEIKTDVHKKKIPVIIVTSSKEDSDINAAYNLGANSYVVKPVDFDDFVSTINQLCLYWLKINQKPC